MRLASESRSTLAAARALNSDPKRLYAWHKAAQQPLPADPAEVRALRLANKRGTQELEILKKASASCLLGAQALGHPDAVSQLQFMDQQRLHYPVQLRCQVLTIVPGRYYAWRKGAATGTVAKPGPAWETVLLDVFDDQQRRYGARRLQVELRELGHHVGRQAVRTALRRHARKALQTKFFVPRTTDSTHGKHCAPNLLLNQPRPTQANRVWVSDST